MWDSLPLLVFMSRQPLMIRLNTTKLIIQNTIIPFLPLHAICFFIDKDLNFCEHTLIPNLGLQSLRATRYPSHNPIHLLARPAQLHLSVQITALQDELVPGPGRRS